MLELFYCPGKKPGAHWHSLPRPARGQHKSFVSVELEPVLSPGPQAVQRATAPGLPHLAPPSGGDTAVSDRVPFLQTAALLRSSFSSSC